MNAATAMTINPAEFADSSAGKRILLTAIGNTSCFKWKGTVVELCTETTEDTRILRYISDVSHYPTVRDYLEDPKLWKRSESVWRHSHVSRDEIVKRLSADGAEWAHQVNMEGGICAFVVTCFDDV